tara:strand:- start:2186 stop:2953 length:768 start_codon:yes stop_codon:yes gene_type:complete
MNFFFHTQNEFFDSLLTVPKFQNSGKRAGRQNLYCANVVSKRWNVSKVVCEEDANFWKITGNQKNRDSIYFIAAGQEVSQIQEQNKLIDLNKFTNTLPDYRANLMIKNKVGGFSSYQSEYPFRMTTKLGTLYSDCGSLTGANGTLVGVFVKNIHIYPVEDDVPLYLYDDREGEVVSTLKVGLNRTTFIDLSDFKNRLAHCFLFAKNFLGVPIYVIEYENGSLSFEHTHPPHEAIGGTKRFELVNMLRKKASEKVS